jgi:putative FmdB family regulatory protein
MATYEYECRECRRTMVIDKPMDKADQPEHCDCGQPLRRIYGGHIIMTQRLAHEIEAIRTGEK